MDSAHYLHDEIGIGLARSAMAEIDADAEGEEPRLAA